MSDQDRYWLGIQVGWNAAFEKMRSVTSEAWGHCPKQPPPPKPKRYRPYTPAEAVQFLGHTVEDQCGTLRIISAIGSGYVMGSGHDTMTYEYMAKNCKWYISGEPCGVEVSDE